MEERVSVPSGVTLRTYTYGSQLLSFATSVNAQPPSVRYFGFDGHGNVRELTDSAGAVTDRYDYDAFGNLVAKSGSTTNNYLYCGEQYDPDLGLYYLRARYLNADSGRFWSMDSYLGMDTEPLSLHKYLYATSNPIGAIDPSWKMTLPSVMASTAITGMYAALAIVTIYVAIQITANIPAPITFDLRGFYDGATQVAYVKTVRQIEEEKPQPPEPPKGPSRTPYGKDLPVLVFVESEFPNIAPHIARAQGMNPLWIMLNRGYGSDDPETENRRAAALHGKGRPPFRMSWDEYPFASSLQGGAGASVELVPLQENRRQGGVISAFYRAYDVVPLEAYFVQTIPKRGQ